MPLYEYKCRKCGEKFEAIKTTLERDEAKCPKCGEKAQRQMSIFARSSTGATGSSPKRSGGCYSGG